MNTSYSSNNNPVSNKLVLPMRTPFFSVVIPLYNKAPYVKECLDSVLNQTESNFEVLVIDDGSTDNGPDVIKQTFSDTRISLISKGNGGVSSARNRGIELSLGEYIAFLDADDLWGPTHLHDIRAAIKSNSNDPNVQFFSTGYKRVAPNGSVDGGTLQGDNVRVLSNKEFFSRSNKSLPFTSAVCVKKSALVEVGGFDTRFKIAEDINLWFRLARRFRFCFIEKHSVTYRLDTMNNSYSQNRSREYYKYNGDRVALWSEHVNVNDLWTCLVRYLKVTVKYFVNYQARQTK